MTDAPQTVQFTDAREAADLAGMKRLQQVSTRLVKDDDPTGLLSEIVNTGIDLTATEMLTQVARDLHRDHVRLGVAHPIGQARDVLRRAADEGDTTIAVYPTIDEAVEHLGRLGS